MDDLFTITLYIICTICTNVYTVLIYRVDDLFTITLYIICTICTHVYTILLYRVDEVFTITLYIHFTVYTRLHIVIHMNCLHSNIMYIHMDCLQRNSTHGVSICTGIRMECAGVGVPVTGSVVNFALCTPQGNQAA